MIAYKFLASGAVAPFTGFRWPAPHAWVTASGGQEAWIHACRTGDLPYWLNDELWRIELDGPVQASRYQVASPRARLLERIGRWTPSLGREYARACILHARDVVLAHVGPALRAALEELDEVPAIAAAVQRAGPTSPAVGYLADAAAWVQYGPASASYAAVRLAVSLGGGRDAFEAERAWQAAWLAGRLGLGEPRPAPAPAR